MSSTHFAMVEELAFLVKDNLPCKHLILSMEEALISFLQNDTSPDGVMELEPMNSYDRLLLHRLADIFGFAHESVGEGDDRHLVLQRCPETAIPPILVCDILWQHDEHQSLTVTRQLLKRNEAPQVSSTETPSLPQTSEEREASYVAACERIFSTDVNDMGRCTKQKPQSNPVVAQRMIAHALGHRVNSFRGDISTTDSKKNEEKFAALSITDKDNVDAHSNLNDHEESSFRTGQKMNSMMDHGHHAPLGKNGDCPTPRTGRSGSKYSKDNLKAEHVGAAKRMFAQALGRPSVRSGTLSKCSHREQVDTV